jgi:hypothetical protein
MQKHPREFKKLGKVEWRRIEQPTFPMRMRAMCNQVKSAILSSGHDPFNPQTLAMLEKGLAPVKDEETWKKWWNGNSIPQSAQLAACDEISPGAKYWLEQSELGNPLQRHMLSLDSMGIELTRDGEWWREKFTAQERSLASQKRVWAKFTKSNCDSPGLPLSFERQIIKGEMPDPTFKYATKKDKLNTLIYESNPYQYEFSRSTHMQYIDSEKFGLFRFFECVMYETKLEPLWLKDIWILDMATLIALMRTELVATPEHDAPGLGYLTEGFGFWNRLFWDHFEGTITPMVNFGKRQNPNSLRDMLTLIIGIRKRYYEMMRQAGIGFRDVYHIARPVSVFGARRISDNIIIV